jgi:thymidylate synthase
MVVSFEINKAKELSLVAFIRSNDILMAWGENAIGLTALQHYVSRQLGLHMGYLETISRNAHVYFKRDQNYLRQMGVMYDV